jgi:hypothetical protein
MGTKRTYVAALAALLLLALGLRLGYAWRLGVSPDAGAAVAGVVAVLGVSFAARRWAGDGAGLAAAFFYAVVPAAVVAATRFPADTYAAAAAAWALYFYARGRDAAAPARGSFLWAGALAGIAAALRTPFLALALYFLVDTGVSLARGRGGRRALWLAAFLAVLAAAAGLEIVRTGEPFATLRAAAAAPPLYAGTKYLVRRLFGDAAAMLFWDGLGFGPLVILALAGAAWAVARREAGGGFYAGLLACVIVVYNFAPASWRAYAPMRLEPAWWLLVGLAGAIIAGNAAGRLATAAAAASLGTWAAAAGGAYIVAALWTTGNTAGGVVGFFLATGLVLATLALAGFARRKPAARDAYARLAATLMIGVSLYPLVMLYI